MSTKKRSNTKSGWTKSRDKYGMTNEVLTSLAVEGFLWLLLGLVPYRHHWSTGTGSSFMVQHVCKLNATIAPVK
jgi:hypothetical protein